MNNRASLKPFLQKIPKWPLRGFILLVSLPVFLVFMFVFMANGLLEAFHELKDAWKVAAEPIINHTIEIIDEVKAEAERIEKEWYTDVN